MKLDKKWFEQLLMQDENDRRIVRVLGMTEERGSNVGDNYTTEIKRVTLNVLLGSGARSKVTFIVKKIPESENMRIYHESIHSFKTEIYAFEHILSQMSKLMEEHGDLREVLYGDVKAIASSVLVFEDLCAKGYATENKSKLFDEEHSTIVLSSLGRFHAMGLLLVKRNLINTKDMKEPLIYKKTVINNFLKPALKTLRESIKQNWGPNWCDVITPLSRITEHVDNLIEESKALTETSLTTITHGDCWSGNIMFKKDLNGKILSVKFIDFQYLAYWSFAIDLCLFLHCSVDDDLRKNKLDDLLQAYRDSLIINMNFFGLDSTEVPSLIEMRHILESSKILCFLLKCIYYPLIYCSEVNLENGFEGDEKPVFTTEMFESEKAKEILGGVLRDLKASQLI